MLPTLNPIAALVASLYKEFDGILFIGDPHVSSKRIGRRRDDFTSSVLAKLEYCAQMCHDFNLLPVCLGDLLHNYDDSNLPMLNRLMKVLMSFPVPMVTLEGNHDMDMVSLSDSAAMSLFAANPLAIRIVTKPGLVDTFRIGGKPVRLFMVPHGDPIPAEVPDGEGVAIVVTHHDMAFGSTYPGAKPIRPIKGAAMVVNGHMHDLKESVLAGETWYHNPGNIEPLSIDLIDHVPRAWLWDGSDTTQLVGLDLPHQRDVFDRTGLQVEAGDAAEAVASFMAAQAGVESEFASDIAQTREESDAERTDDASVLQDDMMAVFDAGAITQPAQDLMLSLFANLQQRTLAGKGTLAAV